MRISFYQIPYYSGLPYIEAFKITDGNYLKQIFSSSILQLKKNMFICTDNSL